MLKYLSTKVGLSSSISEDQLENEKQDNNDDTSNKETTTATPPQQQQQQQQQQKDDNDETTPLIPKSTSDDPQEQDDETETKIDEDYRRESWHNDEAVDVVDVAVVNDETRSGTATAQSYTAASSWQPETWAYRLYTAFCILAAFLSFCMLLLQCLSFRLLQRGDFFTDDVCRMFVMILCLAFVLVELPVTANFIPPEYNMLHHWIYRGFWYMYTAAVSAQVAQASMYHVLPQIPTLVEQLTVLIVEINAACVFGVGVVYMFMGIFCLQGLVDRLTAQHDSPRSLWGGVGPGTGVVTTEEVLTV